MERLENKIAVITGASTGIGQASAVALAIEGAHVLALEDRKSTRLNSSHLKLSRMPSSA